MTKVFEPRSSYKPFEYPFAYEAFKRQSEMHWLPSEVPMHEDTRDWNKKLTDRERNLLTQIFRFFTQADIDVAGGYIDKYLPRFKKPELRMMMSSFAAMEAIHIQAYSTLIETVGMPETTYEAFQSYQEMRDKHDFLWEEKEFKSDVEKIAYDLAKFSAFSEGLQLFSSFVILLNFPRHGKMKGMGQIIEWSIRDETLHVESMLKLFKVVVQENPSVWTREFREDLYQLCTKMVYLEDKFIDLAFSEGDVEGITAEEVKQYVRYIADIRLTQLGLTPVYHVAKNPLPWLDWVLNGVERANFFEQRSTEYAKGQVKLNLDGMAW